MDTELIRDWALEQLQALPPSSSCRGQSRLLPLPTVSSSIYCALALSDKLDELPVLEARSIRRRMTQGATFWSWQCELPNREQIHWP